MEFSQKKHNTMRAEKHYAAIQAGKQLVEQHEKPVKSAAIARYVR